MEAEYIFHCQLPLTSPTQLLAFINDPASHGEYDSPSASELRKPNHGMYALRINRGVNAAFLATENRFCEMLHTLASMVKSESSDGLIGRISAELARLDYEKQLQWSQQRAHLTPGWITVNTGTPLLGIDAT